MKTQSITSDATYKEVLAIIRKSSGIDLDKTTNRVPVRIWVNWLKGQDYKENRALSNLGYGLDWGSKTGRFAPYHPKENLFFKHVNHKLRSYTNLEMVKWFARAIVAERDYDGITTATAYKALHVTRIK